jgi:hypothetical protein
MTSTSRRRFLGQSFAVLAGAEAVLLNGARSSGAERAAPERGGDPDPHAARSLNDPHLHLFVDDREIASSEGLLRVVNRPRKHPEPVVVADRPWEGDRAQAWGSVIQ